MNLSDNTAVERDGPEPKVGLFYRWLPFMRWTPSDPERLQSAEEELISFLKTPSDGFYVNVGDVHGSPCRLWTRVFTAPNTDPDLAPLVMMHGMGAGSGLWALNIDSLAAGQNRPVVTVDLPGFARSSRCYFSNDASEAETQLILAIDLWRRALGLEKIILLGHSFGGYLTGCYALKYPEHLEAVVLVDPWGMTGKPADIIQQYNPSLGFKMLFSVVKRFNPLAFLRASGPIGPRVLPRARPDLFQKFFDLMGEEEARRIIPAYLYHCNAHTPAGEAAFHSLCDDFAWAKDPVISRISNIDENLRVSVIYGEDSWIQPKLTEDSLREAGVRNIENIEVFTIPEARHHVYADQFEEFNEILLKIVNSNAKLVKTESELENTKNTSQNYLKLGPGMKITSNGSSQQDPQ